MRRFRRHGHRIVGHHNGTYVYLGETSGAKWPRPWPQAAASIGAMPSSPRSTEALPIEWWPTSKPVPYEANPRVISEAAVEKVALSIGEYGWRQPIVVDEAGVVIAGHTRLRAAQKLGRETVPVHVAHGPHRRPGQGPAPHGQPLRRGVGLGRRPPGRRARRAARPGLRPRLRRLRGGPRRGARERRPARPRRPRRRRRRRAARRRGLPREPPRRPLGLRAAPRALRERDRR